MTAKRTDFKTKGEARVAIAKDVLKWINTEKMSVQQSGYLHSLGDALFDSTDVDNNSDLRDKLQGKECRVCALGAVFLTTVDRFNKVGCADIVSTGNRSDPWGVRYRHFSSLDRDMLTGYLNKYFTPVQLCMIESAFECDTFLEDDVEDNPAAVAKITKADAYGNALAEEGHSSQSRLRKIMENIIKNKGTFKP